MHDCSVTQSPKHTSCVFQLSLVFSPHSNHVALKGIIMSLWQTLSFLGQRGLGSQLWKTFPMHAPPPPHPPTHLSYSYKLDCHMIFPQCCYTIAQHLSILASFAGISSWGYNADLLLLSVHGMKGLVGSCHSHPKKIGMRCMKEVVYSYSTPRRDNYPYSWPHSHSG